MKKEYLKRELNRIYKERKSWNGGLGPFDKVSIKKRELVLIKQYILEKVC